MLEKDYREENLSFTLLKIAALKLNDPNKELERKCNLDTFELEELINKNDLNDLKELIEKHYKYTDSEVAKNILKDWNNQIGNFVKVMPTDYKRVLDEMNLSNKEAS